MKPPGSSRTSRHEITRQVAEVYLAPWKEKGLDTLILGCTHYPLLKTAIRSVIGREIALVDSAESCARFVKERLEDLNLLAKARRRTGTIQPFVTDEADRFTWDAVRTRDGETLIMAVMARPCVAKK